MGKQTAVAMTESDEVEFLRFLRSTTEIEILEASAPTVDSIRVEAFGPRDGHFRYLIWNKRFPWTCEYQRVARGTDDRDDVRYVVSNAHRGPVIEYARHSFTNPRAAHGRIYGSKFFSASELDYDWAAFETWYSRIVRWIRSHGTQLEKGAMRTWYLPDALSRVRGDSSRTPACVAIHRELPRGDYFAPVRAAPQLGHSCSPLGYCAEQ